jgi:hypothetical protein
MVPFTQSNPRKAEEELKHSFAMLKIDTWKTLRRVFEK